MQNRTNTPEIIWRVWVLPGADAWKLASGAEMKHNREARKVSLDEERYGRLIAGRLPLHERLEAEQEELVPAA